MENKIIILIAVILISILSFIIIVTCLYKYYYKGSATIEEENMQKNEEINFDKIYNELLMHICDIGEKELKEFQIMHYFMNNNDIFSINFDRKDEIMLKPIDKRSTDSQIVVMYEDIECILESHSNNLNNELLFKDLFIKFKGKYDKYNKCITSNLYLLQHVTETVIEPMKQVSSDIDRCLYKHYSNEEYFETYILLISWLIQCYNDTNIFKNLIKNYSQQDDFLFMSIDIVILLFKTNENITYKNAFYSFIGLVEIFLQRREVIRNKIYEFQIITETTLIFVHDNIDSDREYPYTKYIKELLKDYILYFSPYNKNEEKYNDDFLNKYDFVNSLDTFPLEILNKYSSIELESNIMNMFWKTENKNKLSHDIVCYIYSLVMYKKTIIAYINIRYKYFKKLYNNRNLQELNDMTCEYNMENIPFKISSLLYLYNKNINSHYVFLDAHYINLALTQKNINNLLSKEQKDNDYNNVPLLTLLKNKNKIPVSANDIHTYDFKDDRKNTNLYKYIMNKLKNISKKSLFNVTIDHINTIDSQYITKFLNNSENFFGKGTILDNICKFFYISAFYQEEDIKNIIINYKDIVDDYLYYIVYFIYICFKNIFDDNNFKTNKNIGNVYCIFLGTIHVINDLQTYKRNKIFTKNLFNFKYIYSLLPSSKYLKYNYNSFCNQSIENINTFINGYLTDSLSKIIFTEHDPMTSINTYIIYLYAIMNNIDNINKYNDKMPKYYFIGPIHMSAKLTDVLTAYTNNAKDYFKVSLEDSMDILQIVNGKLS